MPRASATTVQNTFLKGLLTEASGLNFPEDAVADTFDCVFNLDGSVESRPGLDFEAGYATKDTSRSNAAVTSYVWKDVAGTGDRTFLVVQIGGTLYFYDASDVTAVSASAFATTFSLSAFSPSGAPAPDAYECQFATGNGILFVVHPYTESFRVSYDPTTDTFTPTVISLQARDFEGAFPDGTSTVDSRPAATLGTVNVNHYYNLLNQGWDGGNLNEWDNGGSTFDDISSSYVAIAGRADLPSNADVPWSFKNKFGVWDLGRVPTVYRGNSPAPKGRFIYSIYQTARNTTVGKTGIVEYSTGVNRVSTVAFFAGRVFYGGCAFGKSAAEIYFTQIIERSDQYSACYQINDPTSEDAFDLLPSDGGVIRIQEAGSILKLFVTAGGLLVCATNGVWLITGSTGLGFTASDYTVNKIASVGALSASSFVDASGAPIWWNVDGIYMAAQNQTGSLAVQSLSLNTIQSFFDSISPTSKKLAHGTFNPVTGIVYWTYKSTDTGTFDQLREFDRVLCYNVRTGSFYPWETNITNVKLLSAATVQQQTAQSDASIRTKFIVTYTVAGVQKLTLANAKDNTHWKDWYSFDSQGVDYNAYFVSGAKVHGEGMRQVQPTYLNIFSRADEATKYDFQTRWNYAVSADTGKWGQPQRVSQTDTIYAYLTRRLKVRGTGVAFQYRISQVPGSPFKIIGWSGFETANQQP